jgi:hypothetical protein
MRLGEANPASASVMKLMGCAGAQAVLRPTIIAPARPVAKTGLMAAAAWR